MSTAVVSGRIDASIKSQVDAIIRNADSSISEVIDIVWRTIARTGELPQSPEQIDELAGQRERFEAYEAWLATFPEPNPAFADMTDDEILATRVDRYV